jgi:hypothetical protein
MMGRRKEPGLKGAANVFVIYGSITSKVDANELALKGIESSHTTIFVLGT